VGANTGTLSIEHEDLAFPAVEGVRRSVELLRAALEAQPAA
jgi:sugar phosphate isomerase/epimerase